MESGNVTLSALYKLEYNELVWSSGVFIGSIFTGGLVVLGIICLVLLSSQTSGPPKQRHLLQIYILCLLLATIGLELTYFFLVNGLGLFRPRTRAQMIGDYLGKLRFPADLLPVIVLGMTDGLFTWRCYMVQSAVGQRLESSKWQNIFWIFPACLWIVNLVTGIWATAADKTVGDETIARILQSILFISNATLNLHATLFISLRLLLHRRMVLGSFGNKAPPAPYLHIISILLQSAAINVPIAVVAAVGVWIGSNFGIAAIPAACGGQAFASVLIIHQVAIGRTGSQREEVSKRLAGSTGRYDSEFGKSDSAV